MSRNIENHDSVLLLQDCIAGCKMALESMDDIREHTDDKQSLCVPDIFYDGLSDGLGRTCCRCRGYPDCRIKTI